jgi:hypothetical protein
MHLFLVPRSPSPMAHVGQGPPLLAYAGIHPSGGGGRVREQSFRPVGIRDLGCALGDTIEDAQRLKTTF